MRRGKFSKMLSLIIIISREVCVCVCVCVRGEARTGQSLGHCTCFTRIHWCFWEDVDIAVYISRLYYWEDWKCHLQNYSVLTVDTGKVDGAATDRQFRTILVQ